ncbi:MAG: hypothetical protein R3F34_00300 [Planctomycetota bacterium]
MMLVTKYVVRVLAPFALVAGAAIGFDASWSSTASPVAAQDGDADVEAWREAVARDRLLSFDVPGGLDPAIVATARDEKVRGLAAIALAGGGVPNAAARLTALARDASPALYPRVVIALASLPDPPIDTILELARRVDAATAEIVVALLALSDDPKVRTGIAPYAEPGKALEPTITAARAFAADPENAPPVTALLPYFDMRYEAAQRFGRVGGEPWRARRLRQLGNDERWLADVVLPLGASVERPWTRDHLFEALLDGRSEFVHDAAVEHLAAELVQLVSTSVWTPADEEGWHSLLDAVIDSPDTIAFSAILSRARLDDVPESVRRRAACALFAVGLAEQSDQTVRDLLASDDASEKLLALRAVADGPLVEGTEFFDEYLDDPDVRIRAVASVAVLFRAPGTAGDSVRASLVKDAVFRSAVVDELLRRSDVPSASAYLSVASGLGGLSIEQQLRIGAVLLRGGSVNALPGVTKLFDAGADGPGAGEALEAYARVDPVGGTRFAVEALLFGADRDLTIAAGRILVRDRHVLGQALLRRAIWMRDPAVCQLAAAFLVDTEGLSALETEAAFAPLDAVESDLRRVGVAIGEWGGYGAVERLASTRSLRDPVLQGACLGAFASRTR